MKTQLNIILIAILLITPFLSFSQTNYTVIGKVVDENGYLPAGNVIALHPVDSSFISGNSFFAGEFELNDLKQQDILLQFTSLEFADAFVAIRYENNSPIDLGNIQVQKSAVALDEIVVKGRRPIYTQKADGTIAVLTQINLVQICL
mgnify:CR=1 FL=1